MSVAVGRGGRGGKSSSRDLDDDGQEDGWSRLRLQTISLPLVARDGQLNCNLLAEGLLTKFLSLAVSTSSSFLDDSETVLDDLPSSESGESRVSPPMHVSKSLHFSC